MDRPAYDPNAQRLERQDQEHEIKIDRKRELKMIRNSQKITKEKIEPKSKWTLPKFFGIVILSVQGSSE